MKPTLELMIDFETLGLPARMSDYPHPIQLSAALFNPVTFEVVDVFNMFIKEEPGMCGVVTSSTVAFWLGQADGPRSLMANALRNGFPLQAVLRCFVHWLRNKRADNPSSDEVRFSTIWSNGSREDVLWLQRMAEDRNIELPGISYNNVMCFRTYRKFARLLCPTAIDSVANENQHDAMEDCVYQVKVLAAITRHLQAAVNTLKSMNYTYKEGAAMWKPPLGPNPFDKE